MYNSLSSIGERKAEYITDMKYDYFGRRLVTTSADGAMRIRDLNEHGTWTVREGCELKVTHLGVVWKVDWARPEFGQLLATCSQDRSVKIWEEHGEDLSQGERGIPRWHCVSSLSESRRGVCDVKFAPLHLGLQIAAASEDGMVRVYKAMDPVYVGSWTSGPNDSFQPDHMQAGVTCISWCLSQFESALLAVGTMLGLVQIWMNDDVGVWTKVLDLPGHDSRAVSCVDWAPHMGRSFHRIASCGADGRLQVHKVTSSRETGEEWRHDHTHQLQAGKNYEAEWNAGRCVWNITGTCLTSAGDDAAVRLWGADHDGTWSCIDTLHEANVDRKAKQPSGEAMTAPAMTVATMGVAAEDG